VIGSRLHPALSAFAPACWPYSWFLATARQFFRNAAGLSALVHARLRQRAAIGLGDHASCELAPSLASVSQAKPTAAAAPRPALEQHAPKHRLRATLPLIGRQAQPAGACTPSLLYRCRADTAGRGDIARPIAEIDAAWRNRSIATRGRAHCGIGNAIEVVLPERHKRAGDKARLLAVRRLVGVVFVRLRKYSNARSLFWPRLRRRHTCGQFHIAPACPSRADIQASSPPDPACRNAILACPSANSSFGVARWTGARRPRCGGRRALTGRRRLGRPSKLAAGEKPSASAISPQLEDNINVRIARLLSRTARMRDGAIARRPDLLGVFPQIPDQILARGPFQSFARPQARPPTKDGENSILSVQSNHVAVAQERRSGRQPQPQARHGRPEAARRAREAASVIKATCRPCPAGTRAAPWSPASRACPTALGLRIG